MKFLKTNTATRVCVGPFLDVTDGVTPETALTVTNCTCEMFVEANDGSGVTRTALTLSASGGNNDMVHITSDVGGYYDLELTAANLNVLGRMTLSIIDTDVHCPVFHEYMILPATVFDSLVAGTDTLPVDTTQWLGTACATPTVNGVPEVDVTHWIGTAAATPTNAGVPEVDLTHISGSAVSTSTAQLGVNTVSLSADSITNTALATTAVTEVVNGILAGVVDGSYTVGDMLYLLGAALGGKVSGMDSNSPVFRNAADTANAISATTDANGNRTAVTLTLPL